MKKTLVVFLPGKSLKNKEEGENIRKELIEDGYDVYFHQWRHWLDETVEFSINEEVNLIAEKLKEYSFEELFIIAKSIGTYVSLQILKQNIYDINHLVLMGIPFRDLNESEMAEYAEVLPIYDGQITIIQNREDDHGTIRDIQPLLNTGFKHDLIVKESTDHRYNYPEILKLILALRV